ncbi:hypothetical protein ASG01_13220 [Chryseobacterium sp. Leaf180]|uniref:type II toxin-antitoxin system RelE/ParE family toxin n=1 Tax=Chryseobacterium sp. Leaf180 TaxID=1736289 RepID=UPI0007015FE7|nr:type II toxin-antitoxin system RelE/ParE family toxin [Chryseobacterium sp. Leaf180]KQR91956.1 hypothetical protein ASG01_13220 [Chryseobacterium sp. Leaf180]
MFRHFYILSEAADHDLEDIFDFTEENFGFAQAEKYLLEIEERIQQLCIHPELGKRREEIKENLYSFPKDNHVIFYRIFADHLRIVRILHGSKDLPVHF